MPTSSIPPALVYSQRADELIRLIDRIGDDGRGDSRDVARLILLGEDPYVMCILSENNQRLVLRKVQAVLQRR